VADVSESGLQLCQKTHVLQKKVATLLTKSVSVRVSQEKEMRVRARASTLTLFQYPNGQKLQPDD